MQWDEKEFDTQFYLPHKAYSFRHPILKSCMAKAPSDTNM